MIEVNNLHKYFGELEVLRGINASISKGEVVCVIGPSGSGKSTFLRCLNLLEEPTKGEVFLDGVSIAEHKKDIDKLRQKTGMVFQQFNLFPNMENIEGISISDKEQLVENGYDLEEIGRKLADNYMKQIIDDGFFHADPHPGNIIIREGKIVWIDMGMMGRLPLRDQRLLGTAIEAVARHDIGTIKDVVLTIGVFRGKGKINHIRLYADIDDIMSKYGTLDLSEMNLSAVISDVLGIAKEHEISMPRGFSMLARGIATIEGVVADLSPAVNLIEITAARVSGNYLHNIDVKKEMTEISRKTLESGRKSLDIPALASDLLKMSIKGQTKINMEIQGSEDMNRIINRTVDRLVTGLLAAALLIGSSIVCTTDMEPKLLGIPALGVLGYTAAVILSVRLLIDMIANLLKRRF